MGLGYENFSKPDVHIKDIFQGLGLCPWGSSDYEVFKAVARVARNAGVTPYSVDRLFWLIGSGYLHGEPHIGDEGKIRGRKKAFIEAARAKARPWRISAPSLLLLIGQPLASIRRRDHRASSPTHASVPGGRWGSRWAQAPVWGPGARGWRSASG